MSEIDYEYECMRAELLGLPKPDKEEFATRSNEVEIEDGTGVGGVPEEELSVQDEQMKNVAGGLNEINSILQTTQKKINKFKTVFGSVTSLLKTRVSAGESSSETSSIAGADDKPDAGLQVMDDQLASTGEASSAQTDANVQQLPIKDPRSMDISQMVGSHISTLDSMIYKAEEVNAKMSHQNKQMRIFINK
ncbi:hypothetical protein LSTR_LSTR006483 [Laodelphax striatellus]|uniref:t-SNARE coiled-coil homology domain-containing protein n=1 Tax=Laodelphax striatellus TaxID=195883 RepID=A0A482WX37_LAOST|nr:hypothetical protein LSTR_LSTR006483 [Laodelphax striatellus]